MIGSIVRQKQGLEKFLMQKNLSQRFLLGALLMTGPFTAKLAGAQAQNSDLPLEMIHTATEIRNLSKNINPTNENKICEDVARFDRATKPLGVLPPHCVRGVDVTVIGPSTMPRHIRASIAEVTVRHTPRSRNASTEQHDLEEMKVLEKALIQVVGPVLAKPGTN